MTGLRGELTLCTKIRPEDVVELPGTALPRASNADKRRFCHPGVLLRMGADQYSVSLDEVLLPIWTGEPVATGSHSPQTTPFRITSRLVEMGTTGALRMFCQRNPSLDECRDRGKEYDDFESLDKCAEKAKFCLADELSRARIAGAYREQTLREHLWPRRFASLFAQMDASWT